MKIELENVLPREIEKRSFELITEELGERTFRKNKNRSSNAAFTPVQILIMQIISVFPKVLSKKQKKRSETEPAL